MQTDAGDGYAGASGCWHWFAYSGGSTPASARQFPTGAQYKGAFEVVRHPTTEVCASGGGRCSLVDGLRDDAALTARLPGSTHWEGFGPVTQASPHEVQREDAAGALTYVARLRTWCEAEPDCMAFGQMADNTWRAYAWQVDGATGIGGGPFAGAVGSPGLRTRHYLPI